MAVRSTKVRPRPEWAHERSFVDVTPADPRDLAEAIAFALRYSGGKRVHYADAYMAQIAAERIVQHLERSRFVVMGRSPIGGSAGLGPD